MNAGSSSCAFGAAGVLTTSPETVPVRAISAGVGLYGRIEIGAERRVEVREPVAPRAVGDAGHSGRDLAVELADGADAPVDGLDPLGLRVEGVELALVGDVRRREEREARAQEPDLVHRCALDRRPADEARGLRVERPRPVAPAHVETVGGAPAAVVALGPDAANACVEGVRVAGHPGEGDGDRRRGALERHARGRARIDSGALGEVLARRELELVRLRARHRVPGEGRGAREVSVVERVRLVDSEEERLQAAGGLERLRCRGGLDAHAEREQHENSGDSESDRHGKSVLRHRWLSRASLIRGRGRVPPAVRPPGRARQSRVGRRSGAKRATRPRRGRTEAPAPASQGR